MGKGIVSITLNRPEKRNALNYELAKEFLDCIQREEKRSRVLIITGAGTSFCAGLDLQETLDKEVNEKVAHTVYSLFKCLYETPLITISAINGPAVAAGGGIVAASDFAIATQKCEIGFPEVRRGISPSQITVLLRRKISQRDMAELLFCGKLVDANRAIEMKLINCIVDVVELKQAALDLAQEIIKGAPRAIQRTKMLLRTLGAKPIDEELKLAFQIYLESRQDVEAEEGVKAFFEKRDPVWGD